MVLNDDDVIGEYIRRGPRLREHRYVLAIACMQPNKCPFLLLTCSASYIHLFHVSTRSTICTKFSVTINFLHYFFFNEYFLHKFGQSLPFIPYKISCTNYYFYCDQLNLALDVFANSRSCAVSTEQTILLHFTKDVFVNFSTNASCTSRIQTLRQGG